MQNQKGNISVILSFVLVVILVGGTFYFTMKREDKINNLEANKKEELPLTVNFGEESQTNESQNINQESNNPTTNNMEQISKNGDTLIMNYTGRFVDGTSFDSNVDPKFGHVKPFEFVLGAGQVIKGWDEGLLGMKVGEKKTLTVPPEKGYGPNDYSGIPGNSTLIFEVELVGIK